MKAAAEKLHLAEHEVCALFSIAADRHFCQPALVTV
jgi:hypothetical protein